MLRVRFNLLLLVFAGIVMAGCQTFDYMDNYSISISSINNAKGKIFMQYLSKDKQKEDAFFQALGGNSPFLEDVDIATITDMGLCFRIPYGDAMDKSVKGAVFYPIQYNIKNSTGLVELGDHLLAPQFIDAYSLENEIPLSKRFVYSYYFTSLNTTLNVEPALMKYEYIGRHVVKYPLSPFEEKTFKKQVKTRSITDCFKFKIYLYYQATYIGEPTQYDEVEIWALSTNAFSKYIEEACQSLGYSCSGFYGHAGYLEFNVESTEDLRNNFLQGLTLEIKWRASMHGWDIIIQGSTIWCIDEPITFPDDSGTGGGYGNRPKDGNDPKTGITTGSTTETEKKSKKKVHPIEEDCDPFKDSPLQPKMDDIIKNMKDALDLHRGTTDWHDYNHFLDAMQDTIEHGFNFDKMDNNYSFSREHIGSKNKTSLDGIYSTTLARFHNHPKGSFSSPSFMDLLSVCKGKIESGEINNSNYLGDFNISFQGESITIYGIEPSDPVHMQTLYDKLAEHIDPETNSLKNDDFSKELHDKMGIINDDEHFAIALMVASDMLTEGHGVKVFRYKTTINELKRGSSKEFTHYGIRQKNIPNSDKTTYELIKCNE